MENMTEKYVAPEVLVVECQVEKGFATSAAPIDDMPYGGGWR